MSIGNVTGNETAGACARYQNLSTSCHADTGKQSGSPSIFTDTAGSTACNPGGSSGSGGPSSDSGCNFSA